MSPTAGDETSRERNPENGRCQDFGRRHRYSQDSYTPIDHGHLARNCSIKIITPAVKSSVISFTLELKKKLHPGSWPDWGSKLGPLWEATTLPLDHNGGLCINWLLNAHQNRLLFVIKFTYTLYESGPIWSHALYPGPWLKIPYKNLFVGIITTIIVFCPRAGLSLQAQELRLQFCRRQVFYRKLRNQVCNFTIDWIGAVSSL